MAIIVPDLTLGHAKVTTGERRFASRLKHLLEDDYWCFYDLPVGKRRRYPDFIILHPRRGLLFLEVKDWKLKSIRRIDHQSVELETLDGPQTRVNPVEQARQGAYASIDMLRGDPQLREKRGKHEGSLICPYGYGVVLTNITRKVIDGEEPFWERQVDSVISGVEKGWIPREQYGALLIDEGHDFEEEWLRLVVQMIDRNTNSLLLLYDDGQAIYRRNSLGFSLSSVGVQARGRTKILKLNYRNTREILTFAYAFARDYLREKNADDDHVPLVVPETAGMRGPKPIFRRLDSFEEETPFVAGCVAKWHNEGIPWRNTAIIYGAHWLGKAVARKLRQRSVPYQLLDTPKSRKQYDPQGDAVVILTRQSSKGLEFPRVILVGLGKLRAEPENVAAETRTLYVAMTRARECLLVTASAANVYTQKIESITTANNGELAL